MSSSGRNDCTCTSREHWQVTQRLGNASAFNGYRWQHSQYSQVRCARCRATWRTKARYVNTLPDAPANWYELA